jgi:hypothetical protein
MQTIYKNKKSVSPVYIDQFVERHFASTESTAAGEEQEEQELVEFA